MQLIDMGPLAEFSKKMKRLKQRFSDRVYRFRRLVGQGNFWIFEEEDEDDIYGAVLQVQAGRVYAISDDVYEAVNTALNRKR